MFHALSRFFKCIKYMSMVNNTIPYTTILSLAKLYRCNWQHVTLIMLKMTFSHHSTYIKQDDKISNETNPYKKCFFYYTKDNANNKHTFYFHIHINRILIIGLYVASVTT